MARLFDSVPNSRKIEGFSSKFGKMKSNILFRSGTLSGLSDGDRDKMKSLGIKKILDLRSENAKRREIDPTSLDNDFVYRSYFIKAGESIPLTKEANINLYKTMFLSRDELLPILQEIEKGTLIHCSAGKDRTGVIISIVLLILGANEKDINDEYLLSYNDLETHLKNLDERGIDYNEIYYKKDETLLKSVFESLKSSFKKKENYFSYLGLEEKDIERIRSLFF